MTPTYETILHPKKTGMRLLIEKKRGEQKEIMGEHLFTWENSTANVLKIIEKKRSDNGIGVCMTNDAIHCYRKLSKAEGKEILSILNAKKGKAK